MVATDSCLLHEYWRSGRLSVYWDTRWVCTRNSLTTLAPPWLEKENPELAGNFKVKYWHPDWKRTIFGNNGSYLDIVDGYNYFEGK